MIKLSRLRKDITHHMTEPLVRILSAMSISPNMLTWFGFLVTLGAAVLIAIGYSLAGALLVLFAGFFDMLDGALARRTNRVTRFGGILDSTLDRLSEAALLLGILVLFISNQDQSVLFSVISKKSSIFLVGLALVSSFLVSYIRARAEALGIDCQVGIFTRAERVVVLVVGLMINQIAIVLAAIVALSLITAAQRVIYVWQQVKE